jgi:hypothetical protein
MVTQSFYTPQTAAQVLGCTEAEVMDHIKGGRLKAAFMSNIANYVITHNDLMSFLKATKDFKTVQKMLTRRIILVDRDPKIQDIMRMELGRQGFEVKVATTEREVAFLIDEYQPDVICVHIGATTRGKEPVKGSLERARSQCRSYIILYHNYLSHIVNTPEFQQQLKEIKADAVVTCDRSSAPLIDAVRVRFGLKPPGPGTAVRR